MLDHEDVGSLDLSMVSKSADVHSVEIVFIPAQLHLAIFAFCFYSNLF